VRAADLPNRGAVNEGGLSPAVGMSYADGLTALNEKFGYDAGNALLKAKADALKEAGIDAYHDKGDEFLYRGDSPEELNAKLEKARELLRNRIIDFQKADGSIISFKGADFSYGTDTELSGAEQGLKNNKAGREARGERARGELRGIVEVGPEGRGFDNSAPSRKEVKLAQILRDIKAGSFNGVSRLRKFVEEKITNAEAAAAFDLSAEELSKSAQESSGPGDRARETPWQAAELGTRPDARATASTEFGYELAKRTLWSSASQDCKEPRCGVSFGPSLLNQCAIPL